QHRDEAVEPVYAGEGAHAWPRLEIEDPFAPRLQLLGADLEELVAREGIKDIEEALTCVAGGGVARSREHRLDLVAQQRDLAWRGHIGLRCEQTNAPHLALPRPVAPGCLYTD